MIKVKNIVKTYYSGDIETKVLRGVNLEVRNGEFLAIMGKSGTGKSTLMYQMSLLDNPTEGEIEISGTSASLMSEKERTQFRLTNLGYVFQDYALVPELTAVENVMIPLLMKGYSNEDAESMSLDALGRVEMDYRINNRPSQLSGGEQQRVSIARAVAGNPNILFADEPTANLDSVSSDAVLDVLKKLHDDGQTIIMVTHEKEYTQYCDRIIFLDDGKIVKEENK